MPIQINITCISLNSWLVILAEKLQLLQSKNNMESDEDYFGKLAHVSFLIFSKIASGYVAFPCYTYTYFHLFIIYVHVSLHLIPVPLL